jgi:hypothetical protein
VWRHRVKAKGLSLLAISLSALLIFPSASSLALTNVESQICDDFEQPLITAPADGTHTKDAWVMVTGTGEATMAVTIVVNGSPVATGSVAGDGTFSLSAPLEVGQSTLLVRESNDCSTTKETSPITVVREQDSTPQNPETPPEPPEEVLPSTDGLHQNIPNAPTPPQSSSGLRKPVITAPMKGATTSVSRILVAGSAHPGSLVTIYVNGLSEAQVVASSDGLFAAQVNLDEGKNKLQVLSQSGKQRALSDEQMVTFVPVITPGQTKADGRNMLVTIVVAGLAVGASASAVGVGVWGAHKIRVRLRWWK